jgi:hypothetical protein
VPVAVVVITFSMQVVSASFGGGLVIGDGGLD